jgi:hypothetical protein
MPYIWEGWSADPGTNGNRPPPDGAPEGRTSHGQLSDIIRRVMAATYEIGNQVKEITGGLGTLGTLARQNKELVDITGGTIKGVAIDSSNAINAGAIKSGSIPADRMAGTASSLIAGDASKAFGLTKQQLYDMVWPIGSERAFDSTDPAGLVPEGVTATWSRRGLDSILVGAGSTYSYGVTQGSGTTASAASDGAHTHVAGGTALTAAQLPAHTHLYSWPGSGGSGGGGGGADLDGGNPYTEFETSSVGSGATHTHTIASGGAHTHSVTLPARYPTVWYKRTA